MPQTAPEELARGSVSGRSGSCCHRRAERRLPRDCFVYATVVRLGGGLADSSARGGAAAFCSTWARIDGSMSLRTFARVRTPGCLDHRFHASACGDDGRLKTASSQLARQISFAETLISFAVGRP